MRRMLLGAALAAALALTVTPAHAAPAGTVRVSTDGGGVQLTSTSYGGTAGGGGRYVLFASADPTGGYDTRLFVKDLRTGSLTRVPEDMLYTTGPMLSANGRRIAYSDGDRYPKPYVYDRASGETRQLWPAQPPDGARYELGVAAAISADGGQVAYTIGNRNGDQYARVLYVRDLAAGTDERISPLPPEGMITGASLSADGRTVAYGLRNGSQTALYVRDRDSGATARVDTGTDATLVQLSADGRRVLFNSLSADGTSAAYIRDLRTGRVRAAGAGTAEAADASLRHVVLAGDTGLVLLDSRTGARRTVAPPGSTAVPGAVTRDGRSVVFTSAADDLVPGDTNGVPDVFLHRLR